MILSGKFKGIIIVIVCIILLVSYDRCRKNTLNISNNYTIAKVIEIREGKGSKYVVYKYFLDNNKYEGSFDIKYLSKTSSIFYKVKYDSKKPNWSEILLNQPVTDTAAIKAAGFSLPQKKRNQFQE